MAVKCPTCGSFNTQSLVDRYQCLSGAHEFFPDGSPAGSDAYPLVETADTVPANTADADAPKPKRGLLKK